MKYAIIMTIALVGFILISSLQNQAFDECMQAGIQTEQTCKLYSY